MEQEDQTMWSNWAGNETVAAPVLRPTTRDELAEALRVDRVLRPVGAGHSFTPIVAADAVLDPGGLEGPLVGAQEGSAVWLRATARLHELSAAMADKGLAFRNLGDINVQSLAGAAATGTHGTGETLPCLGAEIAAARLMTAEGDLLDTSGDADLTRAAQVSLGLFGVMVEAQVNVMPRHRLHRRVTMEPDRVLFDTADARWAEHRNYEMFLIPHSGKGLALRHDLTEADETKPPLSLDELSLALLRFGAKLRRLHPALQRGLLAAMSAVVGDEEQVGEAWKVLSSPRNTRFTEMEYHLPAEGAIEVVQAVYQRMLTRHPEVYFPVELRKTAGDDAWLSPFTGGARVSMAIHAHHRDDHLAAMRDLEPLLIEAGGRPHWGKLHWQEGAALAQMYPRYHDFCELRARLDPKGRFLSPAMARLVS